MNTIWLVPWAMSFLPEKGNAGAEEAAALPDDVDVGK